jgi:hypothetical protein
MSKSSLYKNTQKKIVRCEEISLFFSLSLFVKILSSNFFFVCVLCVLATAAPTVLQAFLTLTFMYHCCVCVCVCVEREREREREYVRTQVEIEAFEVERNDPFANIYRSVVVVVEKKKAYVHILWCSKRERERERERESTYVPKSRSKLLKLSETNNPFPNTFIVGLIVVVVVVVDQRERKRRAQQNF